MKQVLTLAAGFAVVSSWAIPVRAGTLKCPPDSVKVGNACIDLYEASVWQVAPTNTALIKKVQAGKVTLEDLTSGGATQLNPSVCNAYPSNFPATGQWTPVAGSNPPNPGVYAVSIPGVLPSASFTWFQANLACAFSGKRLLRNDEWQRAAAGTPDINSDNGTTDCNISTAGHAVDTGSRSNCKSSWGVFDMVGNASELVADWVEPANKGCTDWTTATGTIPGSDVSCFGGDGSLKMPAALIRGGEPSARRRMAFRRSDDDAAAEPAPDAESEEPDDDERRAELPDEARLVTRSAFPEARRRTISATPSSASAAGT